MGIAGPLFDKEGQISAKELSKKRGVGRKLAGPAEVKKVVVYSNKEGDDTVELTGGFINIRYH